MKKILFGLMIAISLVTQPCSAGIITVNGNGNTGFGGTVGTGSLTLDHNGTTLSGTFNRGGSNLDNAVVLYFDTDSGATGFASTAGFTDTADGLRRAISGNSSNSQTVANFASGFLANYAIAFDAGFGGLWQLNNGGSHNYITSINLTPTGNPSAAAHTFSVNLVDMGIVVPATPVSFVGTYISTTGFRSNEAFGDIGAVPGNPGFTDPITFRNSFSVVPEPTSLLMVGLVGLAGLARRRK